MSITKNDIGKYKTRIHPFRSDDKSLLTKIVRIESVNDDGSFVCNLIHNFQPIKAIAIAKSGNDDGWADVTELVYQANTVIPCPVDYCKYSSATSAVYRDYLMELQQAQPIPINESVGKLCVAGIVSGNQLHFNRCAEFVAAISNGLAITYYGFCPHNVTDDDITVRIVKLGSFDFYPAETIVEYCNRALQIDLKSAYEMVAAASANQSPKDNLGYSTVSTLHLT